MAQAYDEEAWAEGDAGSLREAVAPAHDGVAWDDEGGLGGLFVDRTHQAFHTAMNVHAVLLSQTKVLCGDEELSVWDLSEPYYCFP